MSNLAIIPARSQSKGLKNKNIKDLCGRPLMAYSIKAAKDSDCFDEIMVSTDSEEYAEIARAYGAAVPFLRSDELSNDAADTWDVVENVLTYYEKKGISFDSVCLLQPTSPLRTEKDIKSAYSLFEERAKTAVVSVCETEHSPLWCGNIPDDLSLDGFIDLKAAKQRQSLGKYYRLNGAIYIVSVDAFRKNRFLYRDGSYAYIMDQMHSVDIDSELDFVLAEAIIKAELAGRFENQ